MESQACSCKFHGEPILVDEARSKHLDSLLRENSPPSKAEIQTVSNDIELYDREISRLQSVIILLENRHKVFTDYVSKCRSLLAPIRKIPDDILVEIFSYLCKDNIIALGHRQDLRTLSLCWVSSHWRSLVMARPNLWSIFELWVDVPVSSPESPKLVSLLQHHLTFSGTLPLTVSCSGSIEKGWKHPAIELFLQHSHRWYILSSAYSIIDTSNHYPLLERLDLPSIDTSKGPLVAPRLWSLSWAIFHPDHIQEPNIPWDQLREIVPPQISPQQCADIFSRCSRLESATVAIRESDEDEDGPNIIHSSTLVHLSLEYPTFMDSLQHRLGDLFRITSFPCLEELTLVNESPPTNWTKDEFAAFTLRSPHISILHLRDLNMHIRDLMDLLHLLPTLTEFDFHRISRSYTSLDPLFSGLRLFHHSNQDVLLPRLTKLELRIPSHFDYMIFVEMAKSRWNPPKPVAILRSLRLHSDPVSFDDEMLSSLIELREAGMMIDITDRSGVIV